MESFSRCCCLFFLLVAFTPSIFSQELPAASRQDPTAAQWSDYTITRLGADSRLYNGLEYIRNGTFAKGFPFFDADSFRTGDLYYDGQLFRHVSMKYDLVEDKLIIPDFTGKALISLISEKLSYFTIGASHFSYIDAAGSSILHTSGFYQELYNKNSILLLEKREKKLIFPSKPDEQPHYDQYNTYFLLLDHQYYPIAGENDLLDALKDKRSVLKQYIRKNKLRFRRNFESSLIRTTDYYVQIRH